MGQETRFVELAGEINRAMPEKVVARVGRALAVQKKKLRGARVLVLGLAYKANVEDDRESPSYRLLDSAHWPAARRWRIMTPMCQSSSPRAGTLALGGKTKSVKMEPGE